MPADASPTMAPSEASSAQAKTWHHRLKAVAAKHPILALTLLTLIFHLPGLTSLPPLDRDEARFAQSSAQMLESRDFIDIRFQDQPRYKKPIGLYWLQSLSVSAFSSVEARQIWAYRLPSLAGALIAVLLTFWGGRRLFGADAAFMGASLLCASLVLVAESGLAKTDAALLAAITAAQMTLGRIYVDARHHQDAQGFTSPGVLALVFWVAIGVALLIKGPVALIVAGLTLAALAIADRDLAWFKRLSILPGLVIVAVIALPWSAAIWRVTDGAFFLQAVGGDVLPKLFSGQESHWAPPLYFTALSPLLLWPGSLFLVPAAIAAWTQRTHAATRFCLAWVVPSWLFFELVPTKLPHYVLPMFPGVALLCAAMLVRNTARLENAPFGVKALSWTGAGLWGVVTALIAAALVGLPMAYGAGSHWYDLWAAVTVLAMGLASLSLFNRDRWRAAAQTALITAWIGTAFLLQVTLPGLDRLNLSAGMADLVAPYRDADTVIAAVGYHEPSLVFLLGTDTRLVTAARAARILAQNPHALAIIEQRELPEFLDQMGALGLTGTALASLQGVNYSRGHDVTLTLYRAEK